LFSEVNRKILQSAQVTLAQNRCQIEAAAQQRALRTDNERSALQNAAADRLI
jgi:hypothetical protein